MYNILLDNRACLPQAGFRPDCRQASCSDASPTKSFWRACPEVVYFLLLHNKLQVYKNWLNLQPEFERLSEMGALTSKQMKKDIHPENYRLVAFKDMSNDDVFLTKSTAETKETLEVDGVEYPLVKLEISRTSHPFYTGKAKFLDTAGRIDKFKSKYDKFKKKATPAETKKVEEKAPEVKAEASTEEE